MGVELPLPFPRMRWDEAMERFGLDKPDTRFGLELVCIDEWAREQRVQGLPHGRDREGGRVMGTGVPAEHTLSRKDIGRARGGRQGVRRQGPRLVEGGSATAGGAGPLKRFVDHARAAAAELMQRLGAATGDLCLFVADKGAGRHAARARRAAQPPRLASSS